MEKLVFASRNKGKIKEIKNLLTDYDVLSLDDVGFVGEIEETGSSFEENSYIKAKTIHDFCGLNCLADDSGLCVDALNGAPGVYSARYAGENANDENNRHLLLTNMQGVSDRRARFITVATFIDERGKVTVAKGRTCGKILTEEVGTNGFGYDPLFFSDDLKMSFGLATDEQKNSVSHRARALKNLTEQLERQ